MVLPGLSLLKNLQLLQHDPLSALRQATHSHRWSRLHAQRCNLGRAQSSTRSATENGGNTRKTLFLETHLLFREKKEDNTPKKTWRREEKPKQSLPPGISAILDSSSSRTPHQALGSFCLSRTMKETCFTFGSWKSGASHRVFSLQSLPANSFVVVFPRASWRGARFYGPWKIFHTVFWEMSTC